jgi:hypothetical protein
MSALAFRVHHKISAQRTQFMKVIQGGVWQAGWHKAMDLAGFTSSWWRT